MHKNKSSALHFIGPWTHFDCYEPFCSEETILFQSCSGWMGSSSPFCGWIDASKLQFHLRKTRKIVSDHNNIIFRVSHHYVWLIRSEIRTIGTTFHKQLDKTRWTKQPSAAPSRPGRTRPTPRQRHSNIFWQFSRNTHDSGGTMARRDTGSARTRCVE